MIPNSPLLLAIPEDNLKLITSFLNNSEQRKFSNCSKTIAHLVASQRIFSLSTSILRWLDANQNHSKLKLVNRENFTVSAIKKKALDTFQGFEAAKPFHLVSHADKYIKFSGYQPEVFAEMWKENKSNAISYLKTFKCLNYKVALDIATHSVDTLTHLKENDIKRLLPYIGDATLDEDFSTPENLRYVIIDKVLETANLDLIKEYAKASPLFLKKALAWAKEQSQDALLEELHSFSLSPIICEVSEIKTFEKYLDCRSSFQLDLLKKPLSRIQFSEKALRTILDELHSRPSCASEMSLIIEIETFLEATQEKALPARLATTLSLQFAELLLFMALSTDSNQQQTKDFLHFYSSHIGEHLLRNQGPFCLENWPFTVDNTFRLMEFIDNDFKWKQVEWFISKENQLSSITKHTADWISKILTSNKHFTEKLLLSDIWDQPFTKKWLSIIFKDNTHAEEFLSTLPAEKKMEIFISAAENGDEETLNIFLQNATLRPTDNEILDVFTREKNIATISRLGLYLFSGI